MNVQELQMNTAEFDAVMKNCSYLGITRESLAICGGSWPKASLLSALAYWYRPGKNGKGRATKFRDGLYWVYKTAEQWQAEIGLTQWEFRIALDALEAMGLIARRSMKAPNPKGQWVKQLHLSLDKNLLVKMVNNVQATHDHPHAVANSTAPCAASLVLHKNETSLPIASVIHPDLSVPQDHVLSQPQNDSTEGFTEGIKALKTGADKTSPNGEDLLTKDDKENGKTKVMKESSLQKGNQLANDHSQNSECNQDLPHMQSTELVIAQKEANGTAPGLDGLWQSLTGQEVKTPKQRGQLHFLGKCLGLEVAQEVMSYAVHDWISFAVYSQCVNGLGSYADKPNIGFLSKYLKDAYCKYVKSLYPWQREQTEGKLRAHRESVARTKFIAWVKKFPGRTDEENSVTYGAWGEEFYDISFDLVEKWLAEYQAVHGVVSNDKKSLAA